jgi:hypothetical protein
VLVAQEVLPVAQHQLLVVILRFHQSLLLEVVEVVGLMVLLLLVVVVAVVPQEM